MRRMLLAFFMVLMVPAQAWTGGVLPAMPESVGDLARVELLVGAAAQDEVDRLHGKPLPAEESLVARYARPGADSRPAEVWVSRVSSEAEARRQTGVMVHMMFENPKSPFKNPRRIEHGDAAVYRFEGMGQVHLIWSSCDLVYWISSAAGDEKLMLDTFCLPSGH
jgi:hypothetical protein